jgi:hypothetical protein
MSDKINSKTVGGLFDFCDFMVEKGYAPTTAMDPWKTAAKKVFAAVYGDDFESESLEGIDLEDILGRFETLTRGKYKHESLVTYGRRVKNAIDGYMEFLDTGRPPQMRKNRATPAKKTEAKTPPKATRKAAPESPAMGELVKFPFPLRNGEMAQLQLPPRLQQEDADRLSAFLRTLQVETQKELPERTGEEAEAA